MPTETYDYRETLHLFQAEGYGQEDIDAAIDSLTDAGIEYADEGETILTASEIDVLRDQLSACASRANLLSCVSQAGDLAQIMDWQTGHRVQVEVLSAQRLPDFATLCVVSGIWTHTDGMPVVVCPDGSTFTPADWQEGYCGSIEDTRWVDDHGRDAVVLDGLPRMI